MDFLTHITEFYFFTFLVIFLRVTSFYFAAPIFGGAGVPSHVKVGLGILTSMVLLYTIQPGTFHFPGTVTELAVMTVTEILIGLLLGYAVALLFAAIQIAGMLMGYQMGFAVANVLDPTSNEQVSIIGHFLFIFAILYFLTLNGHHLLIRALTDSFTLAPPMGVGLSGNSVTIMINMFTGMFTLGLQIALPVIGTLFLIDVSLGIIAKTVPQMNVFIVGLPLKSLVGLLIMFVTFGLLNLLMNVEVGKLVVNLYWLMKSLAVG